MDPGKETLAKMTVMVGEEEVIGTMLGRTGTAAGQQQAAEEDQQEEGECVGITTCLIEMRGPWTDLFLVAADHQREAGSKDDWEGDLHSEFPHI